MGNGFSLFLMLSRHNNMGWILNEFILLEPSTGTHNLLFKWHAPIFLFFTSESLQFWYHKNCHTFLIIILKFHALIPLRLEENCKNSPILLTWWLPAVNNHVFCGFRS